MREWLVVVVVVCAGLAGCIGGDDPVVPANATNTSPDTAANASVPTFPNGTPAPTTLQLQDCREHFGFFAVPAAAYEDRLPEGFSFAPLLGEPTGATAGRGGAELLVFGQECQLSDGSTFSRAWTSLVVDPSDAWEHPDAEYHELVLAYVTTSDREAAVNAAWGLDPVVTTGDVSLRTGEAPAAAAGSLQVSAGEVSLSLESAVGGEPTSLEPGLSRAFALAEDGTATGAKDVTWTSATTIPGGGTVSGTAEAGIADEVPADASGASHYWNFDQRHSVVDLPPREGT